MNNKTGSKRIQLLDNVYSLSCLWISLVAHLCVQCCSACTPLETVSWAGFVARLEEPGFDHICGFTIEGAGCPDSRETGGYTVKDEQLVFCGDYQSPNSESCIINCPYAHLMVQGFFDFLSFTIMGAKETFLTVEPGGYLIGERLIFEDNGSYNKVGGAIKIEEGGAVELETPRFNRNKGLHGGAIFNEGSLAVYGGTFADNYAVSSGGAIWSIGEQLYVGGSSFVRNHAYEGGAVWASGGVGSSYLEFNTWQRNSAFDVGPAVFEDAPDVVSHSSNTACGNVGCDGVETRDNVCVPFQYKCVLPPTSAPTPRPVPTSMNPTRSPTLGPSPRPSLSHQPSNRPSSISSAPSSFPSRFPSSFPSTIPSSFPSSFPSDMPSLVPTETSPPSSRPSDMPSLVPTESEAPSDAPSNVPTIHPTEVV